MKMMMWLTQLMYGRDRLRRSSGLQVRPNTLNNGVCLRRMTGMLGENLTDLSIRASIPTARQIRERSNRIPATTCAEEYLDVSMAICGVNITNTRPDLTR